MPPSINCLILHNAFSSGTQDQLCVALATLNRLVLQNSIQSMPLLYAKRVISRR